MPYRNINRRNAYRSARRYWRQKRMSSLSMWKRRTLAKDLIYAPCTSIPQAISTAVTVGGINLAIPLSNLLTGSNDWTNRQGAYKKFLLKSMTIKIVSTSISNVGVAVFGHNPNTTGTPGSMSVVTDLKNNIMVQASSNTPKIFYSSDIQLENMTGSLLYDVNNSTLNGSIQVFMNTNASAANVLTFFMEVTFHTYFSYLA